MQERRHPSNPWLDMAQWLAECSGAWKPQPGIGHTRAGSGSTSQRVNSSGCMRVDRLWWLWGAVCILGCAIGWTAGNSKQVRTTRCSPPSCAFRISSAPHTGTVSACTHPELCLRARAEACARCGRSGVRLEPWILDWSARVGMGAVKASRSLPLQASHFALSALFCAALVFCAWHIALWSF